jgi:hypothetical protein
MIRCGKCGTINKPDETFCTECNAYLEWSGERIEDETPAAVPPATPGPALPLAPPARQAPHVPPMAVPPPAPPNPRATTPAGPSGPVGSQAGSSRMPPPASPASPSWSAPPSPTPALVEPPTATSATRDAAALAADPEVPPARKPTAAPAEPRARKPEKGSATPAPKAKPPAAPTTDAIKPGDRICPSCGSGNEPTRKFCRRCGTSLHEAVLAPEPAPARVPWYRRRFGRRREVETYAAGARPISMAGSSRSRRRLRLPNLRGAVIGLMVLLGLGAFASYLYMPDVTNTADDVMRMVRDRFTPPAPVVPVSFQGQAERGHGTGQAFDGDNSATYWLSPPPSAGQPSLRVFFQDPIDLRRIEIMGGAPGDDYAIYARPRTIALRTPGGNQRISLTDTPDVQPFDIDLAVAEGEALRIDVVDTYAGQGSKGVAIRNLVFGASD